MGMIINRLLLKAMEEVQQKKESVSVRMANNGVGNSVWG